MENKFLIFGVVFLVVLLSIAVIVKLNINGQAINGDLNKYSSEEIPQECKLPPWQDIQSWKEHLGHHAETRDCLEYFK